LSYPAPHALVLCSASSRTQPSGTGQMDRKVFRVEASWLTRGRRYSAKWGTCISCEWPDYDQVLTLVGILWRRPNDTNPGIVKSVHSTPSTASSARLCLPIAAAQGRRRPPPRSRGAASRAHSSSGRQLQLRRWRDSSGRRGGDGDSRPLRVAACECMPVGWKHPSSVRGVRRNVPTRSHPEE